MRIFNYNGRLNRLQYNLLAIIITFILAVVNSYRQYDIEAYIGIAIFVELVLIFLYSFLAVKRFHDLGKPGWYFWLLFIPLVNFYWGVLLIARRGTIGSNEYGLDPLEKKL